MYTKPIYPLATMIGWTRKYIFLFLIIAVLSVFLYDTLGWKFVSLPWRPIGLVGTALAFIVGFKNNASYGRLWEARKIWGGIVNESRLFTTMVNDFITNEHAEKTHTEKELYAIRKELIMRHIGWMTALRHALRQKKPWETTTYNRTDKRYIKRLVVREYEYTLDEELSDYLKPEEKEQVLKMTNKQTACLNLQSKLIKELKMKGLIEDFRHIEFKNSIGALFTLQGKAERIKNFPYPRQFATLNLYFVWLFLLLLPFGLVGEFDAIGKSLVEYFETSGYRILANNFVWLTIPFSIVISWIFMVMERIGDISENPFEGTGNDVPITTIARGIEIDIREMIGEEQSTIPRPHPISAGSQL